MATYIASGSCHSLRDTGLSIMVPRYPSKCPPKQERAHTLWRRKPLYFSVSECDILGLNWHSSTHLGPAQVIVRAGFIFTSGDATADSVVLSFCLRMSSLNLFSLLSLPRLGAATGGAAAVAGAASSRCRRCSICWPIRGELTWHQPITAHLVDEGADLVLLLRGQHLLVQLRKNR